MTDCVGLGRLFGHKYRPRISVTERANPTMARIQSDGPVAADVLRNMYVLKGREYHGDLCERCGKVVQLADR